MKERFDTVYCNKDNEIIIEEKKIKSIGENYVQVKVKNHFPLKTFIYLIFSYLSISFVVLGVLVLCGI